MIYASIYTTSERECALFRSVALRK